MCEIWAFRYFWPMRRRTRARGTGYLTPKSATPCTCLRTPKIALGHSTGEYGHRVKAIEGIDTALQELNLALQSDKK
jgi:hypothetical protein